MGWAVLLMAYGGPNSLDDVGPYLLDVRGGRETSPELVEAVRERYAKIGGRSPLLAITREQAAALEAQLNRGGSRHKVFVGMRHWYPYISEAVEEIRRAGFRRVIALCMAPHYSRMSVGAYAEKLRQAVGSDGDLDVKLVESWHDHPLFIKALAAKVCAGLEKFSESERRDVRVIFTAHSLPAAIMAQGDPYASQFEQTAELVAQAAGLARPAWMAAYQSAGAGSTRWLGPSLLEMLPRLADEGVKNLLVAPVGFVADHVEILYEIDIEAREEAEKLGMRLERTESPNASPDFIAALADIVEREMRE